ncbi:MAG: PEGA domain-containing protein [Myxococcales bacterium]|nr:PEGA domain-containing protein [Myxococcales bacterium]
MLSRGASTEIDLATAAVGSTLRGAGHTVPDPDAMRERFEAEISAAPPEVSDTQIDEWVARSQSAVRNLSRGEYDAARADLAESQRLIERAFAELNREVGRARQVLDSCLYFVRSLFETREFETANQAVLQCRRLVPGVEASRFQHPPEILDMLARIDQRLSRGPRGTLVVESTPSGCAVRFNGLASGTTPFVLDGIAPGTWRVQVECGEDERGRVHRVEVAPGENRVQIDTAFDHAFATSPAGLRMRAAASVGHAHTLARRLGVRVVLVDSSGEGMRATVVDGRGGQQVVELGEEVDTRRVVQALGAELPPLDDERPATRGASTRTAGHGPPSLVGGAVVGALGLGAFATSLALHFMRADRGDRYAIAQPLDVDFLTRKAAWENLALPTHLLAFAGGALTSAALALALPPRDGVPIWAWVSGAVGLGLAISAGALVATYDPCTNDADSSAACVSRGQATQRTSLLGAAALPLLTVPLTYLFGRGRTPTLAPEMAAGEGYFYISLRGTL